MGSRSGNGKRYIQKIAAKAFTYNGEGGNPVTVFLSDFPILSSDIRQRLAKTCEWESVFGFLNNSRRNNYDENGDCKNQGTADPDVMYNQGPGPFSRFYFYMPSGEEVSFCAHAAIGASVVVEQKNQMNATTVDNSNFSATMILSQFYAGDSDTLVQTTVRKQCDGTDAEAELILMDEHATLYESDCLGEESIHDLLQDVALSSADCCESSSSSSSSALNLNLPHGINSSVARNKTLVAVDSVQRLHEASNPPDADRFRRLCDNIDSTGLYLYSKLPGRPDTYECRQFPRASGYPEDPATGIAAAALAASLRSRKLCGTSLDFFQGTSMGRRSRIGIRFENLNHHNNCDKTGSDEEECDDDLSKEILYCSGSVTILSEEEIEI